MPVRMSSLFDVSPNNADDKSLLTYDNSVGDFKFRNITSDLVLQRSSADENISDEFVTKVEQTVDRDKIVVVSYDGGSF